MRTASRFDASEAQTDNAERLTVSLMPRTMMLVWRPEIIDDSCDLDRSSVLRVGQDDLFAGGGFPRAARRRPACGVLIGTRAGDVDTVSGGQIRALLHRTPRWVSDKPIHPAEGPEVEADMSIDAPQPAEATWCSMPADLRLGGVPNARSRSRAAGRGCAVWPGRHRSAVR